MTLKISLFLGLGLGMAYILVDASTGWAVWLFLMFTGARYVHTLFYLLGIQPWRTVAYAVGVVCMFIMSIQILVALP